MSSDEKNFNYFVECREDINSRKLIAELASFFAEQYDDQRIFIITKEKLTKDEAIKFFGELSESKRQRVNFMYCKSYQTVLESLLGMDLQSSIPKVLIIDQLHQWSSTSNFTLEKMPTIYSTIVAALQDLVNVNSRRLQQSCFSFVTSDISEFPRSIIELFYGAQIVAEEDCFAPIFRQHKNQRTDF